MNTNHYSTHQLEEVLHMVAAVQMPCRDQLMKALQIEISRRYLERFDPENMAMETWPSLHDQLCEMDIKQLDGWLDEFLQANLHIPRELYLVLEAKRERESLLLLKKKIEEAKRKK